VRSRRPLLALILGWALLTLGLVGGATAHAYTPPGGQQGPSFPPTATATVSPTGTKPESKLWYAHGAWWAVMQQTSGASTVWRLNDDAWTDTGTSVDPRVLGRADVLSEPDGSLTVASHSFVDAGHNFPAPPRTGDGAALLYRYDFDGTGYTLRAGYPATINLDKSETLVIDRDSTGVLWATWTYGEQAWYAHTEIGDASWTPPQQVPGTGALDSDDISSLVHFGGAIGIMVSDQLDTKVRFAVHPDGASDLTWSTEVVPTGATADDHINLKADDQGRVFAALKTSDDLPGDPLVLLAVRSAAGTWSTDVFGTVTDAHTRPIVLLDEQHREVHLLATDAQVGGDIVEKVTSMDNPNFASGRGATVLHRTGSGTRLNDVTSTKQNLDGSTDLVALADEGKAVGISWFGDVDLGPASPTARFTATPESGPPPLTVRFTDTSPGLPTSRSWSFGDGQTSTDLAPTHTYDAPGAYTVGLTVTAKGVSASTTRVITVGAAAPPPPPPAPPDPGPQLPPGTAPANLPTTGGAGAARKAVATLAGTVALRGRRVTTSIRCRASGRATLSLRGRRLATLRYACRNGRATLRFTVSAAGVGRLKRATRPQVTITITTAAGRATLRHRLQRASD
jgi:hypothetical protein